MTNANTSARTDEAAETVRREMRCWYRTNYPWKREPTIRDFFRSRASKLDEDRIAVLDQLVKNLGEGFEVQHLTLMHLIQLQPL